jgi:hypothetical protein
MADGNSAPAAPKANPENEDPLFEGILKSADLIRYIGQNAVCWAPDVFPAATWRAMVLEIAEEADKIIRACGITDLDSHFENIWDMLGMRRNERGIDYKPYEGVDGNA